MATSMPNFNFLAPYGGGPKLKTGSCWSQSGQISTCSHRTWNAYQRTKFQLSSSISFGDM